MHESTGPLSDSDVDRIKKMVKNLDGLVNVEITNNVLPNIITVSHRSSGVPLRDIIRSIKDLGYISAKYQPEGDDNNIRTIL